MSRLAIMFLGWLSTALCLGACAPASTPPAPTTAPTFTPPPAQLTEAQLLNATYPRFQSSAQVTLNAGVFTTGTTSVRLLEPPTWGDLTGDGLMDAAVLLAENTGGSGTFISLVAVVNANSQPLALASVPLGDRVRPTTMTVSGAYVALDMLVHGPDDPACCPNQRVAHTYRLAGSTLALWRVVSYTPTGRTRAIDLNPLTLGAGNNLRVLGTVTIAPFEASLVYRFVDAQGNDLDTGAIPVTATDMGGPGAFTATLNVPANAARLQVFEMSMADGSMLALDSLAVR